MVVLVRCNDETISVALESCLERLVKGGLIKAWLNNGEWVTASGTKTAPAVRRRVVARVVTAAVA